MNDLDEISVENRHHVRTNAEEGTPIQRLTATTPNKTGITRTEPSEEYGGQRRPLSS